MTCSDGTVSTGITTNATQMLTICMCVPAYAKSEERILESARCLITSCQQTLHRAAIVLKLSPNWLPRPHTPGLAEDRGGNRKRVLAAPVQHHCKHDSGGHLLRLPVGLGHAPPWLIRGCYGSCSIRSYRICITQCGEINWVNVMY